jgi:DNA primase
MKADSLLEEIKSKIDIVEFISEYVPLKKAGQNYKGLCPFHSEKTPSFMVSQSKQIFHCFGCGVGGDVVSFLMKHENLSFNEAIRSLAKKAGIQLTQFRFDKNLTERREQILQINKEALEFFVKNLSASERAKAYLEKRGIEETSIHTFSIGYAPEKRDGLFQYLKKKGHGDSLIKDAGLAVYDERGYRDVFRGRIIFPIWNPHNDVIAFGGRVMDSSLPKYLNTSETEVFKKGETLFALNLAKEEIRKKGYAIIVEGYLDAIICHQYGFKNTVAPLGTALTQKHLQKLKVLTEKIVLVFDSDDAGISAARRSLTIICEGNFRARVLLLPEGEDPDSFLRKKGSQPFQKMLSQAITMVDFLLSTSKGDRIEKVREALGMISVMKDLIIADELLGELADRSRINEAALRSELKKMRQKSGRQPVEGLRPESSTKNREEYLLLSSIIASPGKADYVFSRLNIEDLKEEPVRSLLKKMKALGGTFDLTSLLDQADHAEKSLITALSLDPGFDLELVDRNIDDCLQTLAQKKCEEKMKRAEESGDIELLNIWLKEKRDLMKGSQ